MCYCIRAQANALPSSFAIADASTARTDRWYAFQNPASLVQTAKWQVAAQYENRYLTAELSTALVQAAYCNSYVNVGMGVSFFGFAEYHELMATVTLARRFGLFSLGLVADVISVYTGPTLGYCTTAVPQIGFTIDATPNLTIGIQTFNPFIQKLKTGSNKRALPAVYAVATDWRFYKGLRWDFQAEYDASSTFRIATGLEWQAIEQLCLKAGVYYKQYLVPCLGIGVNLSGFCFDVNAALHPVLGVTLAGRIAYSWR